MGSGIAQVCASKGLEVLINDRSQELLDKSVQSIRKSLQRLTQKGQLSKQNADDALSKIRTDTSIDVSPCRSTASAWVVTEYPVLWLCQNCQHTCSLQHSLSLICIQGLRHADFVIEAVVEDEAIKRGIFQRLDKVIELYIPSSPGRATICTLCSTMSLGCAEAAHVLPVAMTGVPKALCAEVLWHHYHCRKLHPN